MPLGNTNDNDFNVKFFPVTKVYLGNRMSADNRHKIIEICRSKNIPYIGVRKNPAVFEMEECKAQCEVCTQYINKLADRTWLKVTGFRLLKDSYLAICTL